MTARQRAFLTSYLGPSKGNATRAAEATGYRWPGKQGPRLLTFPEVAAAVGEARARGRAEADALWKQRTRDAADRVFAPAAARPGRRGRYRPRRPERM